MSDIFIEKIEAGPSLAKGPGPTDPNPEPIPVPEPEPRPYRCRT